MTEIRTQSTTHRKVDEGAALAALTKLSAKLSDMKRAKREAAEAEKIAKRDAKKTGILAVLDSGKPSTKSDVWCVRFALSKAVTVVKLGATAEELLACKALQGAAPWADLQEAVREYALAKCADVAVVLEGLGCTGEAPAVAEGQDAPAASDAAPDSPQEAVSPAEAPKARNTRKARAHGRKGA